MSQMSFGAGGELIPVRVEITVDTHKAADQITELNDLLTMYVALARRAGLPPEILKAIRILQQLRIAAEMATKSVLAMYASTGPVGWLIAAGGVATSVYIYSDTLMEMQG